MVDIRSFFEKYADVSGSGNPEDLARFYGRSFLVVGPKDYMTFANDENFITWLKSVQNFNNETGLEKLIIRNITSKAVGLHTLQATVTWGALYKKMPGQVIEFDIHYMLTTFGSDPKIILYISDEDQEQTMKEKGLLG